MKHLYLVRHAKSSWAYNVPDHERSLKERGITDANLVSTHIKSFLEKPDSILSSNAVRTTHTSEIFAANLGIDINSIDYQYFLYDFSGINVLQTIKETKNTVDRLMIFGHNNAMTSIANTYGSEYIDNVPTSGFIHIAFNITTWKQLKQGTTLHAIFPKHLKHDN